MGAGGGVEFLERGVEFGYRAAMFADDELAGVVFSDMWAADVGAHAGDMVDEACALQKLKGAVGDGRLGVAEGIHDLMRRERLVALPNDAEDGAAGVGEAEIVGGAEGLGLRHGVGLAGGVVRTGHGTSLAWIDEMWVER